ncbi:hypothetical protein BJV82DRAFT_583919 [Fennellomyces sp. T-0311]|nr:hypothetical protein BJV82DRAFT_583919 [Fennellomyces sp. T-0311]
MTTVPIDKTRRKRLKVVSACGECRRKKTKCNGENPCTGCIKAKVECKYVTSHKTRTFVRSPAMMMSTDKTQQHHASPQQPQQAHHQQQQQQQQPVSVEAIEERLGVIENILRALLKAQPSTLQLPVFGGSGAYHPRHAPHSHNWHTSTPPITPTPRRPTSAFHLPPLRESSSTTSSSSTSSSSSCTSIRNLLNDDDTLPTPPLTATFQKTHHHHNPPRVYYADEFR